MQEVGGSIPPGSTSLRSLRELRLGKPHRSEGYRGVAQRAKPGFDNFRTRNLVRSLRELRLGKPIVAKAAAA
jgi:hypothetical protein